MTLAREALKSFGASANENPSFCPNKGSADGHPGIE
jgi:hypothetical protein